MTTPTALLDMLTPLAETIGRLDLSGIRLVRRARSAVPSAPGTAPAWRACCSTPGEAAGSRPGRELPRGCSSGGSRSRRPPPTVSIDAVEMEGPAAPHAHPRGEVSFCVAREGQPRFDGRPPGWVVLPPGSHHTPTVEGGRMLIVYFLPDGAVEWGPAAP